MYIPLNTCKVRFGERIVDNRSGSMQAEDTQLTQITVQVNSTNDVLPTVDLIKASLEPYHPKKDVEITVPYDLLLQAQKQAQQFSIRFLRGPAEQPAPNPVSRPVPAPASTPNPGGPAGNLPKAGVAGVVDPARDFARGGGGGMAGTTMRGTGMGGAGAQDRPRYIRTSQLIVVSSPEGDTVTAYSTETGKAKSLRLAKASDTKLEVQPIVSQGLAALYLKGPNITRIAAFSVLDGTWYRRTCASPWTRPCRSSAKAWPPMASAAGSMLSVLSRNAGMSWNCPRGLSLSRPSGTTRSPASSMATFTSSASRPASGKTSTHEPPPMTRTAREP